MFLTVLTVQAPRSQQPIDLRELLLHGGSGSLRDMAQASELTSLTSAIMTPCTIDYGLGLCLGRCAARFRSSTDTVANDLLAGAHKWTA